MLESLLMSAQTLSSPGNGGSDTLIAGNAAAGYYGIVASSDFVTGDVIASTIGLSAGTVNNSSPDWFKFSYNSKILYVPKVPLRQSVSWQAIYQAGAVYGDDTNGAYPSGGNKLQSAKITVGQYSYRVRLMRGATSNPGITAGGELTALFYRIWSIQGGTRWENFTSAQLGITSSVGGLWFHWLLETYSTNTANRLGYLSGSVGNLSQTSPTDTYAWRPVLERM